jgi:hypothetical protein
MRWNANREGSMSQDEGKKALSEPQRRAIFLALVEAQDQQMSVLQSRKVVAKHFRVSDQQVRQIEQEGLDNGWPPL